MSVEDERLPGLVFQVAREMRTAIDRELAPLDITAQQASVLIRSWRRKEIGPNQMASLLGTDTAGMTRLLDRLEAKGLVARRRSQTDRRSIVIELTPAGEALVPKIGPAFDAVRARLLAGFADQESDRLRATLGRMLENLRDAAP